MNVKDKIAKLLALAGNNPSQEEAKAALLRARELMAEHKLRPEECVVNEEPKVVESLIGISVTARKYAWAVPMSGIIAKHYCCIAWRRHTRGTQTQQIGITGLEDDFEICTRIFRYAFDCVTATSEEIYKQDAEWYDARQRRRNAEAYGWAFARGLEKALDKQQEEHQEWGLVMVVPQAVRDTEIGRKKPKAYGDATKALRDSTYEARRRGYEDGLAFDPATKLAEAKAPLAIGG